MNAASPPGPQPLASVCVITCNQRAWIGACLEGALAQRAPFPFEVVVGEDGSTDGTAAVLEACRARHPDRVRVVGGGPNVGAQANLLRTERACRGRYVAYCEGDDFWHAPDKLARQVAMLESDPGLVLAHAEVAQRDESTGETIPRLNRHVGVRNDPGGDLVADLLAGRHIVRTCSACVRAGALRQVLDSDPELYGTNRFPMGDTPRWLGLARLGRFAYLDEPLATYRRCPRSLSNAGHAAGELAFWQAAYALRRYWMDRHATPDAVRRDVARTWGRLILPAAAAAGDGAAARAVRRDWAALGLRPDARDRLRVAAAVAPAWRPVLAALLAVYDAAARRSAPLRRLGRGGG